MEQLIKVILLVVEKYREKINVIISEDMLTLEYLYYINEEKDVYKTMQVTEFEDKISIRFIPEKITRIIEVNELEEIFNTLEKQINHKEHSSEEIKAIKEKYVVGTKVELVKMYDYINPLTAGSIGTIDYVDDAGTLHIAWENGSTLGLVVGIDEFKIMKKGDTENE